MSRKSSYTNVATLGIDIGKNSFHVVGVDERGAIVLRRKFTRRQLEVGLANLRPCLIGMEACVGAHHLARRVTALGHTARLMPAKYVRPYGAQVMPHTDQARSHTSAVGVDRWVGEQIKGTRYGRYG